MSNYKIFTTNHRGWILISVILALFAQVSIAHSAGRLLAWPVDEMVTQAKSQEPLNSYEARKGQIVLAQEILPNSARAVARQTGMAVAKDDIVSINLFADITHEIKIDSVKHHADGTMIISGRLKDHKNGTVVMTIGTEKFLITIQDMKRSMLYRVRGNSRDGSGSVTEIDMKKLPPVIR